MSEIILGIGASGSGKTTSLRNLNPQSTVIITPNSKSLPFPGGDANYQLGVNMYHTNEIGQIWGLIKAISDQAPHIKVICVDDLFHFMTKRILSPAFISRSSGNDAFAKWNEFGADIYNMVFSNAHELRPDLYVVLFSHTTTKDNGTISIKTTGKLLDNTIEIPSHCSYVFHYMVQDSEQGSRYVVQTNRNSIYLAKSPMGSFPDLYIDNDMNAIINRINEYRFGVVESVQAPIADASVPAV